MASMLPPRPPPRCVRFSRRSMCSDRTSRLSSPLDTLIPTPSTCSTGTTPSFPPLGAACHGIFLIFRSAAPLGRECLPILLVCGLLYVVLHILWITAPLGQKGLHLLRLPFPLRGAVFILLAAQTSAVHVMMLLQAGRRGVRRFLKIVSIMGIPMTIFFIMMRGTGHI